MHLPRKLSGIAAVTSAMVLALTACSGDTDDGGGGEDGGTGSLADCYTDNFNECNSGERADGGDITWMVNQGHDGAFNDVRAEGNSVYLTEFLAGIYANPGWYNPDGNWVWNMDVFASEPQQTSVDPMTVVYELRPEAVWNDGTPISVDDFLLYWAFTDPDLCSECAPADTTFGAAIASVEGSGQTVTVTYEDGFVHAEWFTYGAFRMPAHIADQQVGEAWRDDPAAAAEVSQFFLTTVPTWSSGPYIVQSEGDWLADERQTMVPNPAWYGATQPTLDSITKIVVSDQPSWPAAMQNDEIDGGSPASFTTDTQQRLEQLEGVLVGVGTRGSSWDHVDVNVAAIDDVELRKAIFTAIDREDAAGRIYGENTPPLRNNMIFPEVSPFFQDAVTPLGYGAGDVAAAQQILTDAGYTGAEAGGTLTDPDGEAVPPLRFAWLQGNENRAQFVELATSYLAEIGITVEPSPTPPDQLGTVLTERDFDLVVFGWSGTPAFASSPNQFYHSESSSNYGGLNDPQVDELVTDVPNHPTQEEAAAVANEAVPLVLEQAFTLPLWDTPNLVFMREDFANVRDNLVFQERSLYNTEHWGIRAAAE